MRTMILLVLAMVSMVGHGAESKPVYIGFDGEYGLKNSTSAQAIEYGLQIAIDEINEQGGVLGGRPLELITKDNRSVPARGQANIRDFAAMEDLVAVIGGRFSPVIMTELPLIHEQGIVLVDAWGSADGVTNHDYSPSYSFRLSLKDSYAMPTLLDYAQQRDLQKVALLVPQTAWGRSNHAAAETYVSNHKGIRLSGVYWYHWGDDMQTLAAEYTRALASGAQALILVANDIEGSILIRHMATLPEEQRLPVFSHWGVTGGEFVESCQGALDVIDFTFIQTFSLFSADQDKVAAVMKRMHERYGIEQIGDVHSPAGLGHAYDIIHLLAMAIDKAGSTDRDKLRDALEHLGPYEGLVRNYPRAFSPESHDALRAEDVFMARYDEQGRIRPLEP